MSTTKTRRLDLRLTEEQDALIRRAAEQDARSISDFILSTVTMEAQRRLADQRLFILNDPKLRKLFERRSPFGTHIDLSAPNASDH